MCYKIVSYYVFLISLQAKNKIISFVFGVINHNKQHINDA